MTQHLKIPLIFTTLFIISSSSIARHTITPTTPLPDDETLISTSGSFALGFFNPNQEKRYIGLWYIPKKTIVPMVLNRANPLVNSTGALSITSEGTLTITDKDSRVVWSSNATAKLTNPVAQLLDNGNLIVKELLEEGSNYAWQSFDHPTDTLLAGMKLGVDFTRGLNNTLTSWSSPTDPTPGAYQAYMETKGDPEIFVVNGTRRITRTGPWDGAHFSGDPYMWTDQGINYSFIISESIVTYSYELKPSVISILFITPFGGFMRLNWTNQWIPYGKWDSCDQIGMCGNYGWCEMKESAHCNCLMGFVKGDHGRVGCVRKNELDCVNGTDEFGVMSNVKLPQSGNRNVDLSLNLGQCRNLCLGNCSCTAYASAIAANKSGCVIWVGNLYDIRSFKSPYGRDLYVRLNATDVPQSSPVGKSHDRVVAPQGSPVGKSHGRVAVVVVVVSLVAGTLLLCCAGCVLCIWRKKKRKMILDAMNPCHKQFKHEQKDESIYLPIFKFDTIITATNHFSSDNKLGQGGFGPVYKGTLGDDQEIAVKRLSKTSSQGSEEFKAEVMLIAKLQHRNLVRLLGCCIEREERMLIYEYLPNNSLDTFLFDEEKRFLLNWNKRYQIIIGIAKGLLYLHHDSRFRIIHRDLKAGNILLDKEMIPKISDFGLARIFSDDETDLNTRKIVGTYGYMSPEYALDGVFSLKSDVFSFGVLVLEIISAKKNRGVYATLPHINLLAHAWSLWEEGNGIRLVDDSMSGLFSKDEVLRCIKLGLLCVEENPEDRPLMSSIVQMFGSDMKTIPQPKQPGFPARRHGTTKNQNYCSNELSITMFEPR